MRRSLLALAFALVVAAPGLSAPAWAAPPIPQVTVRLDQIPPVEVNHDGSVDITVNGTVNVTVPNFVEVMVSLNVSVTTYWFATITPTGQNLTGSGDVPFVATITVPSRAGAEDQATVQVTANVSAYGVGRDFFGSTEIPIIEFFGVELDPVVPNTSPAKFNAEAGKETAFSFRLKNAGNGHDSFEVRVSNTPELQNLQISTDLASPITNVGSGVTVVVTGSVTLPSGLAVGDYNLALEALSTGAVAEGEEATATTQKTIHATEAVVGPGPGPGPGTGNHSNNTTVGGFLPAPGAMAALSALTVTTVAAAVWRRTKRP